MNQAKKFTLYILLNVVISAATMLGVLFLWENTKLKNALIDGPTAEEVQTDPLANLDQNTESPELEIEIAEAGGVGNLSTEYIRLIHPAGAEETVSLKNWQIQDENNHQFAILNQSGLGDLELHSQGAVNIYTKEGQSNPIELFLGLDEPLWSPGELITLLDPTGEVHDTYLIP